MVVSAGSGSGGAGVAFAFDAERDEEEDGFTPASGSSSFAAFFGEASGFVDSPSTIDVDFGFRFLAGGVDSDSELALDASGFVDSSSSIGVDFGFRFLTEGVDAGSELASEAFGFVDSSSSADADFGFRFVAEGVDAGSALASDFVLAEALGVAFREEEELDFFFDSAPAAIRVKLRMRTKTVRALRIMKLRNNQNLSWFDSVLATQLDVICIKNIGGARF